MSKKRFYSVSLLICVFVLFTSIPFNLFITNQNLIYILQVILKILFLIFAFFYLKKENYNYSFKEKLHLKHLILLPFILVCFSNLFVCLISNSKVTEINMLEFVKDIGFYLLVAISEELVFRYALFNELKAKYSNFLAMLISSLVFGGLHLLNITSFASIPTCLIQALYTFGLGMLLSLIYVYTQNILMTISAHFLFNLINDSLAASLFEINWDFKFYLINILFAIVFAIYGILIYIFKIKKEDN